MKKKICAVLTMALIAMLTILMFTGCTSHNSGKNSDGYYTPTEQEMEQARKDADAWMKDNW